MNKFNYLGRSGAFQTSHRKNHSQIITQLHHTLGSKKVEKLTCIVTVLS